MLYKNKSKFIIRYSVFVVYSKGCYVLAVAFLYICFTGTMFLNSLIMKTNYYPLFIAGARIFGSGVLLLSLYFSKHKSFDSIVGQLWQLVCISFLKYSFCLYTFSAIGFSWGMQYIDPVKACFLFVLSPFITALMLYYWYDEKLSKNKIYGLLIGFTAVIPIILESTHGRASLVPWYFSFFGYIVFTCAVISFSYGWILHKELFEQIHISSSLLTGTAMTCGGAMTLLLFFLLHCQSMSTMQLTDDFWWLLLLFTILTAFGYNLYSSLLKRYSPTFISFASFLEPAFGMLYASIFLGQAISTISLIALVMLGCGLYLFYQEELNFR